MSSLGPLEKHQSNPGEKPLWSPLFPQGTRTFRFRDAVDSKFGTSLTSYEDLYKWSVENISDFWSTVWDETGVVGHKGALVVESATPVQNPAWFPEARVNWAENMLRCRSLATALISISESSSPSASSSLS